MLAQAAGWAVLAALSPTALLVIAVYLGSAQPRRTGTFYLAGAVLMTIITGVIAYAAIRAGGLSRPAEHAPRYGLRLGLGILALVISAFMIARRARSADLGNQSADPDKAGKGILSRIIANPSPGTAFAAGVLVFTPSVSFIAAIQAIATAGASIQLSILALVIVVVLDLLLVWLPILAHLIVPDWTSHTLTSFNGWLRAHGPILAVIVLVAAGVVLTVNGLTGLLQ
ncbi:MAG TPA: GAP family protein [Streptosporangiaceae bacterium]